MRGWMLGGVMAVVVLCNGAGATEVMLKRTAGSYAAKVPKNEAISSTAEFEKYINPAEFEKIAEVKDVTAMGRDTSIGASGMLNFIDKDRKVLFSATFETMDRATYNKNKAAGVWKVAFKGPVEDVGEAAYSGPPTGAPFILAFLKGTHWVTLSGSLNPSTMKPRLSMQQMKALAKIILPRLK